MHREQGSANTKPAALHRLHEHKDAVLRVGWLPGSTTHFASGGDDAAIYIWDLGRVGKLQTEAELEWGPAEIIFKHSGHRGSVQDFHWNPEQTNAGKPNWVMASVSEDGEWAKTNTMQIWRPLDLLYRDDESCIRELGKLQNDFRIRADDA
jgi:histone-binding protein RBBP4